MSFSPDSGPLQTAAASAATSNAASPVSPSRPRKTTKKRERGTVPGLIRPPRLIPKVRPFEEMSIDELRAIHERNIRILAAPSTASTSGYIQKIASEQAAIEAILGIENLRTQLEQTSIADDTNNHMNVDANSQPPPQPLAQPYPQPYPQPITAKQAVVEMWDQRMANAGNTGRTAYISFEEAARIEKEAHAADEQRRQEALERKRRQGLPIPGEQLTRQEREARIWAFMNYKPTDSDQDDDEEDEDDEDPSAWFVDDQDDGRKGQDIVEPDEEDWSNVIRVDHTRLPYSFFPRENRD